MTSEQDILFREQGYLYLPGALGKEVVQPVKAYVLNELKRLKIWSTGRALSGRLKDTPVFQQVGKLGQLIRYPGLTDRLVSLELYSFMRRLAGVTLASGQDAQLLISLPHQGEWTLQGLNWHRDISCLKTARVPGVQAFVLIDDLLPRGGATLALAGSHRLQNPSQSRQGMDKLIQGGADCRVMMDGVELSVVEMAGRAGDVYLMDMGVLHTPSINSTKNVRLMATIRYFAM